MKLNPITAYFPLSPSERAFAIEISGHSPSQAASFWFGSIEVNPAHIVASVGSDGRKQPI
jgi:hypothetical protein